MTWHKQCYSSDQHKAVIQPSSRAVDITCLCGVHWLVFLLHQVLVVVAQTVQAVDEQLLGSSSHQVLLMVCQQQAHVAQQCQVAADVLVMFIDHLRVYVCSSKEGAQEHCIVLRLHAARYGAASCLRLWRGTAKQP